MKPLNIVIIALMTISTGILYSAENWQTVEPLIRGLVFQEFASFLRTWDWETIDDHIALKLRSVTKQLCTEIDEHRDQKITRHKEWLQKIVTDQYDQIARERWHAVATLVLEKEMPIKAVWLRTKYPFFLGGIKNNELDDTHQHLLYPDSIVIGLSGNTLCGIIVSRKEVHNRSDTSLWGPRVRFKLHSDGSVCTSDMEIIQDPHFCQSSKLAISYICNNFNGYACWAVIENHKQASDMENHIIIGSTKTLSCRYKNSMPATEAEWPRIAFSDSTASQYTFTGPGKSPCLLEYRFEKGGTISNCYEHRVFCNDNRSLSLTRLSGVLCNYILHNTPVIAVHGCDNTINPPAQRLVHTFVPNEEWPLEVFERYISHLHCIDSPQHCLDKYSLLDLARLCQIRTLLYLVFGIEKEVDQTIIQRTIMRRSSTATVYCDVFGKPYYCDNKNTKPKLLDNNMGYDQSVFEKWVRRLIPVGPLPGPEYSDYLCKNRHAALQVSAAEFLTFFTLQAEKYAQLTWDNGSLGARWKFDNDGMRIHLYNLNAETNHKIGTYLIQGRSEGTITNIEYAEDQQPIFYVDGNKILE